MLGFDTVQGKLGNHLCRSSHVTCEFAEYVDQKRFFGVTVGRVANRIAQGKFMLQGREYQLAKNNGENHLHGGPTGFHKVQSVRKYLSVVGCKGWNPIRCASSYVHVNLRPQV